MSRVARMRAPALLTESAARDLIGSWPGLDQIAHQHWSLASKNWTEEGRQGGKGVKVEEGTRRAVAGEQAQGAERDSSCRRGRKRGACLREAQHLRQHEVPTQRHVELVPHVEGVHLPAHRGAQRRHVEMILRPGPVLQGVRAADRGEAGTSSAPGGRVKEGLRRRRVKKRGET